MKRSPLLLVGLLLLTTAGLFFYFKRKKQQEDWDAEITKGRFENNMKDLDKRMDSMKNAMQFNKSMDSLLLLLDHKNHPEKYK